MSNLIKIDTAGSRLPFEASDWAIVFDENTGLYWPKDDSGKRLDEAGEAKYIAHLNETAFGGLVDWKSPTRPQVLTLVDLDRYGPAANTDFFPGMKSDYYRTSSECAWSKDENGVASYFWVVGFHHGGVHVLLRSHSAFARAVRGGGAPASQ